MRLENKDKIWFASDYHIYHKNIIRFDKRPFGSLDEMHETLISNWNDKISDSDIVFYLGDISFGGFTETKQFVDKLNGNIHYVMGNHDDIRNIRNLNRFESISDIKDIWVKDEDIRNNFFQNIILSHYPMVSWNRSHHGSYHLHGHCHQSLKNSEIGKMLYKGKILDVGCNGWDYSPISYETIKQEMDKKTQISVDHHK